MRMNGLWNIVRRMAEALPHWREAKKKVENPRLIMTLLVKNEEEKLEANLYFHHAMGVDGFIVTDNNSSDSTMSIIQQYKQKGWILEVIEEPSTGYEQKAWVDRMIQLARKRYQADWIINADADELWYAPSGSLKAELANCRGNIAHCQIRSMSPEADKPFYQWNQRVEFVQDQQAYGLSSYSMFGRQRGKAAHRSDGYIQIGMGNHKVRMLPSCLVESPIRIYHYNMGTRDQFMKKMIQGGRELEQHNSRHGGAHWRYFYGLHKEGRLSEEYDKVIGNNQWERLVADGYIVEDNTIGEYFSNHIQMAE